DQGNLVQYNLYAYTFNNPVNMVDYNGDFAQYALAGGGILSGGYSLGGANFWNPVGWVILGVTTVATGVVLYNQYQNSQSKALANSKALISKASTSMAPLPPNKGGKGTQTPSKTLYNKNGARIDVENPGNRPGQIHLQKNGVKYYYNIQEQVFRIGSSAGKLAPRAIQNMLKNKDVVKAIAKGLTYLGY
ncbi:MAG: hypothetical protein PHT02_15385, partial [Tissierellia bacterium]|nr:hypothetical protein [Tissierellia bacterium]